MTLSRRRFLSLASAACLTGTAAHGFRWQGTALGARAQIVLDHPDAARITRRALAEIDRLENVFSLYRPGSELMRLNDGGRLEAPSFELLDCLGTARLAHRITEGRFDPTVQGLWQVMAEAHAQGSTPDPDNLARARAGIGFDRLRFDSMAVVPAPGQKLTLNGIAQGYIADRVAHLMRAEGIRDVLIDTGEILALGAPKGGAAWPVTIAGEARARALTGRALATSAPMGTVLDAAGRVGHILDPRQGAMSESSIRQISVSASRAALADAVSTGLCLASDAGEARALLRQIKDARIEGVETYTDDV